MRLLLDACVPRKFRFALARRTVSTAHEVGPNQFKDRALLDAAEGLFDVSVTVDRYLQHQQIPSNRPFAISVLRANGNKLSDLLRLVPQLNTVLKAIKPGAVIDIGTP